MLIQILYLFVGIPLLLSLIGFILKISGAVQNETVFYFISGVMLAVLSIGIFTDNIEYRTGSVINGSTETFTYSDISTGTNNIIALSVFSLAIFLVITGFGISRSRNMEKIEDEGSSAW